MNDDVKLSIHIKSEREAYHWMITCQCFDIKSDNISIRNISIGGGLKNPYNDYQISYEDWAKNTSKFFNKKNIKLYTDDVVLIQPSDHTNTRGNIQRHEIVAETNLINFIHPQKCVYLFGPNDGKLTYSEIDNYNIIDMVYIPTPIQFLHSYTAAAIVLYDRLTKLQ